MNYKNSAPFEYDLKQDLFTLESSTHPYFAPQNISEIKKHYSNGLSHYTEKIKVEIVTDIKKCRILWDKFSLKKSLFDTWNFRYSFHEKNKFFPYFLTIKKDSNIVAVLPIYFDNEENSYQWFGTNWQEDNIFCSTDPFYIPLLLFLAPRPISLEAIIKEEVEKIPSFVKFQVDDSKYTLNLNTISSVDDYLSTLRKKKRYNLKRDRKRIEAFHPKIYINRFEDYDEWVKMCYKRFSEKGEKSDFEEDPRNITIFRQIIENGRGIYKPKMISVVIDGKLAAADLNVIYKDIYYPLHGGGYNVDDYPGIGNYMNLIEIQDAIDLGMNKIDFLAINYGWKNTWFPETPLFKYEAK